MKRIKKSRKTRNRPYSFIKEGEYVELESITGLPPRGIYRVEGVFNNILNYSVGDIFGGINLSLVSILRRHLQPPADDRLQEIKHLEASAAMCDCEDCRELLQSKRVALKDVMH